VAKVTSALIAPASFAIIATTLIKTNNWAAWGIEALPAKTPSTVSFGDLANITATVDCLANQIDIEGCDPYARPFQPYVVLPARILSLFNLGIENTGTIGITLAAIFFLTITALAVLLAKSWTRSTPQLFAAQALLALIAIAPASMLAVERGQIEQLTLALVVVALIALSAGNTGVRFIGSLTSLLATMTKYLSAGMFLPFLNRSLFSKLNRAALLGLVLSALFLIWSIPNVLMAAGTSGASEPQTTKSGFSVTTMLATVLTGPDFSYVPTPDVVDNWTTIKLISYAIFIALLITWMAILRLYGSNNQNLPTTSRAWILTMGSGGVLLFPYLLGNSHDYRLIFLIPLVTGAILLSQEHRFIGITLTITATISAVTSASMITTPNDFKLAPNLIIFGDLALMVLLSGVAALWLNTAFNKSKVDSA
jgi:hypothetical protein